MAEIVLGIGSSHGPLLSTPPEQWDLRAKADRENKKHWFRGKTYDFETLLQERAPGFADQVTVEVRRERFQQCRRAMEVLGKKFKETAPDAVVILGNDQREFFDEGLTPSITVYRGAEIKNVQHLHEDVPGLNIAEPGNSPEEGATYPARRSWPITSWIRWPPRISTWRNPTSRRKPRRAAAFRTPTGSCITRSWAIRLRPACRSS